MYREAIVSIYTVSLSMGANRVAAEPKRAEGPEANRRV